MACYGSMVQLNRQAADGLNVEEIDHLNFFITDFFTCDEGLLPAGAIKVIILLVEELLQRYIVEVFRDARVTRGRLSTYRHKVYWYGLFYRVK